MTDENNDSVITASLQQQNGSNGGVSPTVEQRASHGSDNGAVTIADLTPQEQELFDLLLQTAEAYANGTISLPNSTTTTTTTNDNKRQHLTLRVAGGWVRDTIWGLPTHDIDVAVDHVTGVEMATLVQAYCQLNTVAIDCGRMGVIAANPAQSKHLETATMRTCGLEVDYVNLRAQEVYQDDSRIPIVQFGSPLDDAMRRDFTINALFYNLHTKLVEDYTQRGLDDLRSLRLSTPLEPVQTFRDDPLRVLRAVRFAVRYNLNMDPALLCACQLPEIHQALHVKVSRERVGKELEGMLSGKGCKPVAALQLIAQLNLSGSVFCLPMVNGNDDNVVAVHGRIANHEYECKLEDCNDDTSLQQMRELGWQEAFSGLQYCTPVLDSHTQIGEKLQNDNNATILVTKADPRLLPVAVFLLPFRHLHYTERKKVDRDFTAVSYIVRIGIKFKNKDVQAVTLLLESVDQMAQFLRDIEHELRTENKFAVCRLDAGLMLRKSKEMWITLLLLATVLLVREQVALVTNNNDDDDSGQAVDWINICNRVFTKIVVDLYLSQCWKTKPLLDGKNLIESLGLTRGPGVGTYIEEQVNWMLMHPQGTRDECLAHLLKVKQQLQIADSSQQQESRSTNEKGHEISTPLQPNGAETAPHNNGGNDDDDAEKHIAKKIHIENMDLKD